MHAPDCQTKELVRLLFLHKSGEPPGDPGHQISYDHDIVEICPSCNGATLEVLKHDCFDFEEVWDQYEWYELVPADGARLRELAARCGRPLDPFCRCPVHQSLRESARLLPTSGWNAVFEAGAHHHVATLTSGDRPRFRVEERVATAAAPQAGARDRAVWVAIGLSPLVFAGLLVAYFRAANLSWPIDVLVTLAAIPASIVIAVAMVALVAVIIGDGKGSASDKLKSE